MTEDPDPPSVAENGQSTRTTARMKRGAWTTGHTTARRGRLMEAAAQTWTTGRNAAITGKPFRLLPGTVRATVATASLERRALGLRVPGVTTYTPSRGGRPRLRPRDQTCEPARVRTHDRGPAAVPEVRRAPRAGAGRQSGPLYVMVPVAVIPDSNGPPDRPLDAFRGRVERTLQQTHRRRFSQPDPWAKSGRPRVHDVWGRVRCAR